MADQDLANHRRMVPMYHYVAGGLIVVHLVWACVALFQHPTGASIRGVLVGVVLVFLFLYSSSMPGSSLSRRKIESSGSKRGCALLVSYRRISRNERKS